MRESGFVEPNGPGGVASARPAGGGVSAEELAELMRAFNAAAGELEQTHSALRAEVSRLERELNEANVRLERSRRLAALGEMAAGIAHEVRNPLAAIALHAEMLREDLGQNEAGETAEKILRAARELDGVVGDVLRFARELSLSVARVGADEPARRAESTCRAMAERAGVGLELHAGVDLPAIEVDAGLLAQALANLVRNAVEAIVDEGSTGPGRVRVLVDGATLAGGPAVSYAVEDNGPGVPADALERMFNPFYTTRHTGCGLGLAMVQRIVDAHGGRVDACGADGGGARFTLTLPLHAEATVGRDAKAVLTEGAA